MRKQIAAIDAGTYYHHESLRGPRFEAWIDRTIWIRDLPLADLSAVGALIVTDRSNPEQLLLNKNKMLDYLRGGGFLLAMGETRPDLWLDGVRWTARETNWWWWLKPGATLGLATQAPQHALWKHITLKDCQWHYHGFFDPPSGALPLVVLPDGGTLMYEDRVSFAPGRVLVTALDPFYHHGSHFMPATTRFLDGFLPWLRAEADSKSETLKINPLY